MLGQKTRIAPIRSDHEFFDQLPCPVMGLLCQPNHPIVLEDRARLMRLEFKSPLRMALRAKRLRHAVLERQLLRNGRDSRCCLGQGGCALQPRRHRVIGELALVSHLSTHHAAPFNRAIAGKMEFAHQCQAVLIGIERSEVGTQSLRQHRKHPGRRVDRRCVAPGVIVDRRTFPDQRIHIGNRYKYAQTPFPLLLADGQLIEVARIIVIDRAPGQRAQICDGGIDFSRTAADRCQFGLHCRRKHRFKPTLGHGERSDPREVEAIVMPAQTSSLLAVTAVAGRSTRECH